MFSRNGDWESAAEMYGDADVLSGQDWTGADVLSGHDWTENTSPPVWSFPSPPPRLAPHGQRNPVSVNVEMVLTLIITLFGAVLLVFACLMNRRRFASFRMRVERNSTEMEHLRAFPLQ